MSDKSLEKIKLTKFAILSGAATQVRKTTEYVYDDPIAQNSRDDKK